MTWTTLATPVPNTKILVSTFGAVVKQDLDDLDGRVAAINTNLGTWSGGTAITRIQQLETSVSARYETTAATSCANNADTDIPFATVVRSSTAFTASGANFTCTRTGWVDVCTTMRMVATATNLELKIKLNGNLVAGSAGGATLQAGVATGFPITIGDVVKVSVFHSSGAAKTLETGAGRQNHIALSWRGL